MGALKGRAAPVVVAVALLLAGCGADDAGPACPAPTPVAAPPPLAAEIRAERLGTVVGGGQTGALRTLEISSGRSVDDLRERVPAALARAGLAQLSEDYEGFEAEIYFGAETGELTAVARVREDPLCAGRTTVQISVSDGA